NTEGANTNAISEMLNTKPSSVSDMLKKLSEKGYVNYEKYRKPDLTDKGTKSAIKIIRKHRLWETFLVEKLGFKWDEVHDIAEELEHVSSDDLTNRLENFLNFPQFDPHGDPIPDKNGNLQPHRDYMLGDLKEGETAIIVGVKDSSSAFLQYLEKTKLILGVKIKVEEIFEFDQSMNVTINDKEKAIVTPQVSKNLYVRKNNANT
ncbi:MAG: metal-dependent transcriptional regulator, partial [Flavobacteriales bacterium]